MLDLLRRLLRINGGSTPTKDNAVDFKMLTEGGNDVIFRCGQDGTAHYVSPSSVRLFGWTPEEMVGKGPASFVIPEDMPAILAAQMNHAAGDESSVLSYRVRRKTERRFGSKPVPGSWSMLSPALAISWS